MNEIMNEVMREVSFWTFYAVGWIGILYCIGWLAIKTLEIFSTALGVYKDFVDFMRKKHRPKLKKSEWEAEMRRRDGHYDTD